MDNPDLLKGTLVRLTAEDPKVIAETYVSTGRKIANTCACSIRTVSAPVSVKKVIEWVEKDLEKNAPTEYYFLIRTLEDDRLVGAIGLDGNLIAHAEAFVGIGIGERELWGKGYGTDAMRVILRYAFSELNLRRVSLNTFEYNPRASARTRKLALCMRGGCAAICTAAASAGT